LTQKSSEWNLRWEGDLGWDPGIIEEDPLSIVTEVDRMNNLTCIHRFAVLLSEFREGKTDAVDDDDDAYRLIPRVYP
jgi:hypothetical protein